MRKYRYLFMLPIDEKEHKMLIFRYKIQKNIDIASGFLSLFCLKNQKNIAESDKKMKIKQITNLAGAAWRRWGELHFAS